SPPRTDRHQLSASCARPHGDLNPFPTRRSSDVIVDDITAPTPDVANLPNVTGECSATATAPTATDNCSGVITGTTSDPLTYNTQGTYTITWTYDDGNGNTSTQTQNVIITDTTTPVANCQNYTVTLDATGNATINTSQIDNGSSDNCGIQSLSLNN